MECCEMTSKKKLIIILIAIATLALVILSAILITYNAKQADKTAQIKVKNEAIAQAVAIPEILQRSVDAYETFTKETDNQSAIGITPGIGALDVVELIAYGTPEEQAKRCNWDSNSHLRKVLDKQQESVGKLLGSDQKLLETWNEEARAVTDWVMCYKGELTYNKLQVKNGTDDFESISLKIKGRVTTLNEAVEKDKSSLNELESKNPLFL